MEERPEEAGPIEKGPGWPHGTDVRSHMDKWKNRKTLIAVRARQVAIRRRWCQPRLGAYQGVGRPGAAYKLKSPSSVSQASKQTSKQGLGPVSGSCPRALPSNHPHTGSRWTRTRWRRLPGSLRTCSGE